MTGRRLHPRCPTRQNKIRRRRKRRRETRRRWWNTLR
jgi:hypothetical protein